MVGTHKSEHTEIQLTAEYRRGEHIAGIDESDIYIRGQIHVEIYVDRRIKPPNGDFARSRDGTARSHIVVLIDDRKRPTRLLRNRRETPNRPGSQKLMPFSSANEIAGSDAAATTASMALAANESRDRSRPLKIPTTKFFIVPPRKL